jgi:transposase
MSTWSLGLDVAKENLDACLLLPTGKFKHRRFPNHPDGHAALLAWLQQLGAPQVHACLEATGTYGQAIALFLHQQGQTVSVLNPKVVAHYAHSQLRRAKTDRVDAKLLAQYGEKEQPAPWTPPTAELQELQALVRRREALEQMRQMERNRLAAATHPAPVPASLEAHLGYLEEALQATEQAIREHLDQHPGLKKQAELLLSIPGIGETTAVWLLAELGDVKRFRCARQVLAFAGLTPTKAESGQPPHGQERLCKIGSGRLRKALYFPALVALRWNPVVQEFGARLQGKGKHKMVVVGAAMSKLLQLAYGVLKSEKKFTAAYPLVEAA